MLNRRTAQYLPIWQPIPWPRPNGRELDIITIAVVAALMLEILVMSVGLVGLAWSRVPAAPAISAPVVAEPVVAQPVAPVVAPIPAAPVIAPAIAPAPKTIPLAQVSWETVPGAPEAQALFVRDGTLYAVQSLPSGAITWSRNGTKWTSRKATSEEIQLMASRGWLDVGDFVDKLLGGTRWGGAVAVTEQTVTFFQYPGRDSDVYASRLFLRLGEEAWIELNPPQDMGMFYSFVQVGNELFVAGWDAQGISRLWQAKLKNLP